MKNNLINNYFILLLFHIFLLKIKDVKSSTDTSSIHDTISDSDINLLSMEDISLLCTNVEHLLDSEKNKIYYLLISYKHYNDHSVEDESKINECIQKLQNEISVKSEIDFKLDPMELLKVPMKMPKLFVFEVHPILQLPVQPLKYVAKSIQMSNIREEDVPIPLKDIDMKEYENNEEYNTIIDTISDIRTRTESSISSNSEGNQSENNYRGVDSEGSPILDDSSNSILSSIPSFPSFPSFPTPPSLPSLPSLPSFPTPPSPPSPPSLPYDTDHSSALNSHSFIYSPLTTDVSD